MNQTAALSIGILVLIGWLAYLFLEWQRRKDDHEERAKLIDAQNISELLDWLHHRERLRALSRGVVLLGWFVPTLSIAAASWVTPRVIEMPGIVIAVWISAATAALGSTICATVVLGWIRTLSK